MTRQHIFAVIRAHLADELEVDPDSISESTRFREDLEADSLDLYTLVQELLPSSSSSFLSGKSESPRSPPPAGRCRLSAVSTRKRASSW